MLIRIFNQCTLENSKKKKEKKKVVSIHKYMYRKE